ncbi:MAG: hypothetical protein ACFFE2_13420 [Candidatus Thorarchaeota archaeon]
MSDENDERTTIREGFRVQHWTVALVTVIFGLGGAGIFALVNSINMPFKMFTLIKLGLVPSLAIIAVVGGIRGPLAGFLAGYLGMITYDLLLYNTVVILTLPAMAYGVLGFVVGLASYDFSKGRSLGKLSILSAIGLVFTALLLVVIGLFVEQTSALAGIGFILLPLLTTGLPSVILITPILARVWLVLSQNIDMP